MVVTRSLEIPELLRQKAEEKGIPLFQTSLRSIDFIEQVTQFLEEKLAPKRESLLKLNAELTGKLQQEILDAVKKVAKKVGIEMVLDKQVIITGGMDLTDMVITEAGEIQSSDIYLALVRNEAKLAYNSVAAWLEDKESAPDDAVASVPGLAENLRIQDRMAEKLRTRRHERGALDLHTLEARPIFAGDEINDLRAEVANPAKGIIEDFMIAANGVTARFLHGRKVPSLRRMVRSPKRWGRIVEIAAQHQFLLPLEPDSRALARFLAGQNRDKGPFASGLKVIVKGERKGKQVTYTADIVGRMAPGTGLPASIAALMLDAGDVKVKGVVAPEGCIDPEKFIAALIKRGAKIHQTETIRSMP
jgi:hypothetical protein